MILPDHLSRREAPYGTLQREGLQPDENEMEKTWSVHKTSMSLTEVWHAPGEPLGAEAPCGCNLALRVPRSRRAWAYVSCMWRVGHLLGCWGPHTRILGTHKVFFGIHCTTCGAPVNPMVVRDSTGGACRMGAQSTVFPPREAIRILIITNANSDLRAGANNGNGRSVLPIPTPEIGACKTCNMFVCFGGGFQTTFVWSTSTCSEKSHL